jgi:hypothetical protein
MSDRSSLQQYTVRLQVAGESGTGFFVATGLILTCFHVVRAARDGEASIRVIWQGREYRAILKKLPECEGIDLALLELSDAIDHDLVHLENDLRDNDELYTFGYTADYPKAIRAISSLSV